MTAPALTRIVATFYAPDGSRLSGSVSARPSAAFTTPDGYEVLQQNITSEIVDGELDISLVPNAGSTPAGTAYAVFYTFAVASFVERWIVPQTPNPCSLEDVVQ